MFDNVAYGLRVRKLPRGRDRGQCRARARPGADARISPTARRRKLSGGQQQRVALARAIAFSPTVVLFDEPLSNLDAKLRAEMRVELRELQRRLGITSVYVTHDQEEALAISDRVIVMNVGGIEQIGTPEEIYNRPHSRFVADFVGSANLIAGRLTERRRPAACSSCPAGWRFRCPRRRRRAATTTMALRTAYVALAKAGPPKAPRAFAGSIRQRLFHGDFIQYIVDWPAGQLIVRRPPTEMFDEGSKVAIAFAPENCVLL